MRSLRVNKHQLYSYVFRLTKVAEYPHCYRIGENSEHKLNSVIYRVYKKREEIPLTIFSVNDQG